MLKVSLYSIHIITCKPVLHFVAVAAESFEVAYDVIGGEGTDDLMSPEQRRRLEESKKRKKENMMNWAAMNGSGLKRNNMLSMIAAGAGPRKVKRDRTNAPCHDCGQIGHWANEPGCPMMRGGNPGAGAGGGGPIVAVPAPGGAAGEGGVQG